VDKQWATVTVYGEQQRLLAVYPATVGSAQKPSLSGDTKVERIAFDPWYTFDPSVLHFKEVKARGIIKIAPGPKNPVGLVWIALAKGEGYGIHGAPAPDKVSKTASHGCIRLTNWDALELASMVRRGTPVTFAGGEDNADRKNAAHRSRRAQRN
jgi:lipoprotein-anchoring transpeptidase ErfK/SrfK